MHPNKFGTSYCSVLYVKNILYIAQLIVLEQQQLKLSGNQPQDKTQGLNTKKSGGGADGPVARLVQARRLQQSDILNQGPSQISLYSTMADITMYGDWQRVQKITLSLQEQLEERSYFFRMIEGKWANRESMFFFKDMNKRLMG